MYNKIPVIRYQYVLYSALELLQFSSSHIQKRQIAMHH